MNGLTSIVMSQGIQFWKEAGCRKDFSTLVSQTSKCQACQAPSPRGPQEVGTKSENVEEGMEVAKKVLRGHFSIKKVGV